MHSVSVKRRSLSVAADTIVIVLVAAQCCTCRSAAPISTVARGSSSTILSDPSTIANKIWDTNLNAGERYEAVLSWNKLSTSADEALLPDAFARSKPSDSHRIDMLFSALRPPKSDIGTTLFLQAIADVKTSDEADAMAGSFWSITDPKVVSKVLSKLRQLDPTERGLLWQSVKRFERSSKRQR